MTVRAAPRHERRHLARGHLHDRDVLRAVHGERVVHLVVERDALAVGRPARVGVLARALRHAKSIRAIGVGDVDLVTLVVGDVLSIRRSAEAVGELLGVLRQIALVFPVAIHVEGMRVAVDQRLEAEFPRVAGPEEQAAVVEADALDGGDVRRLARGQFQ